MTADNDNSIQENILSASLTSPFTFVQPEFTEFPEGIQEKYKPLYVQNQDFVGWLTVPGTSVDTPVYQTNNNSYYLKHDNYAILDFNVIISQPLCLLSRI